MKIVFIVLFLIFNTSAWCWTGTYFEAENEFQKNNQKSALELWLPLAELGFHVPAYRVSLIYNENGRLTDSLYWLKIAAKNGHHEAIIELCIKYLKEFDKAQTNEAIYIYRSSAKKWCRKAARENIQFGTMALWVMSKTDKSNFSLEEKIKIQISIKIYNIEFDAEDIAFARTSVWPWNKQITEDIEVLLPFARAGWLRHQVRLGDIYASILNKNAKNFAAALYWNKKASERGSPEAMFQLGKQFLEGKGVKKNLKIALMWLMISDANGNKRASRYVKELISELPPEVVDRSRIMAESCVKNSYKIC
ncbi:tetratricopeptide repeat protein [Minwuia sp. IMCC4030]|uniref:tetratricopeptide repeat protein n=1 Tax=Minwuia sp. IMCC4030 TaxID=3040677 RepID=UPI00247A38C6|nr:tetratricopeptide repeat protein [Minwuia sp. IMCC4030]